MNTHSEPFVLCARDARGIVTLTLNRPAAFNALSEGMLAALQTELDAVDTDPGARVVVLAAAGKAFCAGHDLKEMRAEPSLGYYEKLFAQCSRVMLRVQTLSVPVIARVQGIATAAGCQLVAMCDLAVAADTAKFAVSGVNLGLFCSTPSVALARNVPRKQAMEMLLTGDAIDAGRAREIGLVNRVVPAAALDDAVDALARQIAGKSPLTLAIGKEAFYRQAELDLDSAYAYASEVMTRNMLARDAEEGIDAFLGKRPPVWCGN